METSTNGGTKAPAAPKKIHPRWEGRTYSKPWESHNRMNVKPKPGMTNRWLSAERFIDEEKRGPWLPDTGKHPELAKRIDDGGKIGSVTEVPKMILCECPIEMLEERNAAILARCKTTRKQLDKDLERTVKSVGETVFEPEKV